jgi:hypothetical protein
MIMSLNFDIVIVSSSIIRLCILSQNERLSEHSAMVVTATWPTLAEPQPLSVASAATLHRSRDLAVLWAEKC